MVLAEQCGKQLGFSYWYFTKECDTLEKNQKRRWINVLKTKLEVVAIGTPDTAALSKSEQRAFFETLYARVLELAKEKEENWIYCNVLYGRIATHGRQLNLTNCIVLFGAQRTTPPHEKDKKNNWITKIKVNKSVEWVHANSSRDFRRGNSGALKERSTEQIVKVLFCIPLFFCLPKNLKIKE